MPLQRIGNTSVYVIEPPKADAPKTSTGESWSQYYTNLRWKVWGEVAKSQAQQRDVLNAAYKAGIDIYEQQRRDLNRAILEMRELKAKALAGGNTAGQLYRAERDRNAEIERLRKFISDARGGRVTTRQAEVMGFRALEMPDGSVELVFPGEDTYKGVQGKFVEDATTTIRRVPPEILAEAEARYAQLLAGGPSRITSTGAQPTTEAPEPAEGEAAEQLAEDEIPEGEITARERAGISYIDDEIARLEQELASLRMPTLEMEDPLAATRRAYSEQVGVGTPFGMARRPTRELPFFDERELAGRIQDVESAYVQRALNELPPDASVDQIADAMERARQEARIDFRFQGIRRSPEGEFLRREDAFPDIIPDRPVDRAAAREALIDRAGEGVPEKVPTDEFDFEFKPGAVDGITVRDVVYEDLTPEQKEDMARTPEGQDRLRELEDDYIARRSGEGQQPPAAPIAPVVPSVPEVPVAPTAPPTLPAPATPPPIPPVSSELPGAPQSGVAIQSAGLGGGGRTESLPGLPMSALTPPASTADNALDIEAMGGEPDIQFAPGEVFTPGEEALPGTLPTTAPSPAEQSPYQADSEGAGAASEALSPATGGEIPTEPESITDELQDVYEDRGTDGVIQYASNNYDRLLERAREFYQDNEFTRNGRPYTPEFRNDDDMIARYLVDQIMFGLDKSVRPGEEFNSDAEYRRIYREIRRLRRGQTREDKKIKKTRAQEKQSYFLDRMKGGAKLAEQPKKMDRFAKSDLPKEQRPEVATLVEDLMKVSRGRANYFRDVFDEITRYYKDQPSKMAQAHEYLAALQILEGDTLGA